MRHIGIMKAAYYSSNNYASGELKSPRKIF